MDISKLRELMRVKVLNVRAIDRLVNLSSFKRAWEMASPERRDEFSALTRREDCWAWRDKILRENLDLESIPNSQLRIMAKLKGVEGYHHLSRVNLMAELTKNANAS